MAQYRFYKHFMSRTDKALCGHKHESIKAAFECGPEVLVIDIYDTALSLYTAYKYGIVDIQPIIIRESLDS